jgi:hypothetical protein
MTDDKNVEIIAVPTAPGTVVEVDANAMALIILKTCRSTEESACEAANLILDYLIASHSVPSRWQ